MNHHANMIPNQLTHGGAGLVGNLVVSGLHVVGHFAAHVLGAFAHGEKTDLLLKMGGAGGEFRHEQAWVLNLHLVGDAPGKPVLNALGTAALVNPNHFSDFGRPAKAGDQGCIGSFLIHTGNYTRCLI